VNSELFISDLDGTLLDDRGNLSSYSREKLNFLMEQGLDFTVASARSLFSIQKLLKGVNIRLPVIEFNGAFISDFSTGEHLQINSIPQEILEEILLDLATYRQVPLISCFDGKRDRLFYLEISNEGKQWYIEDRKEKKDPRLAWAETLEEAISAEVVCLTIIDRQERLLELNGLLEAKYSDRVEIHLIENQYSPGWFWLTVHDRKASKDQGILTLTQITGHSPDQLTVFGDNLNDLKMFSFAQRAVAVENGQPRVKKAATHLTGSNGEDGVVKFILKNWAGKER